VEQESIGIGIVYCRQEEYTLIDNRAAELGKLGVGSTEGAGADLVVQAGVQLGSQRNV
jgi:hypothetical protein